MAGPDPEGELRRFGQKKKDRKRLKIFATVLVIDAIVIAGYLVLAGAMGWDGTALIIPVLVVSMVTGFWYQWQVQKIERAE